MNISRIKLRHLQVLLVVAQERNLVKAAQSLSVSQPAVSKSLSELESIVGQRLLERHRRGVELTPAGEVLLQHAGASMRSLREGLDAVASQPDARQLGVAVGALPNVASSLLPAAIELLRAGTPRLHLRVLSGTNAQMLSRLRQGELDLVFGRLPEPSDMVGLHFEQLYAEPLRLAVRRRHPLLTAKKLAPGLLSHYPLVLPVAGTPIRRTMDAFLVSHGVAYPDCVVETVDTWFALQYVLRTDAVWFLPAGVLHGAIRPAPIVPLALDTRKTSGAVGLTSRRDVALPDGAHMLADALRAAVRLQPAAE